MLKIDLEGYKSYLENTQAHADNTVRNYIDNAIEYLINVL